MTVTSHIICTVIGSEFHYLVKPQGHSEALILTVRVERIYFYLDMQHVVFIHAGYRKAAEHSDSEQLIEDLKKKTGVTDDQLNQKCTEEHLKKIASSVRNFTKFADVLYLPPGVASCISVDTNESKKAEAVLLKWHKMFFGSTYLLFVQACLHPSVSEGDVAEEMCRLCAGKKFDFLYSHCLSKVPVVQMPHGAEIQRLFVCSYLEIVTSFATISLTPS